MLITSVSADEQVPRTGYFRVSSTPLALLGEQGASALSQVFAADEKLRWQLVVPKNAANRSAVSAVIAWGWGTPSCSMSVA